MLDYLQHGGFPAVRSADPYDRVQMLQEYVDLVVLRDVAERHSATNLPALRSLAAALFAANGNGFSVSRLHGALSSQGHAVGKATLLAYLGHLVDAYLCFLVPLRTRSARQRTVNPRKVYAVDPGLAAAMYGGGATNRGAQLENAVYLELRRRYGRLSGSAITWVKTPSGAEVDFAVDDPVRRGPPRLVLVCSEFDAGKTRQREVDALSEAMQTVGSSSGTIVTSPASLRAATYTCRRAEPGSDCYWDAEPNALLGVCRILSSADFFLPTVQVDPMGHAFSPFTIPFVPTEIHKRYYAQGVVLVGGGSGALRYTNGTRFTIGGVLP